MKKALTVVLLTFNSARIIRETICQAKKVSPNVFVVDSGSTDDTHRLVEQMGCQLVHRAFENYSDQRNWAIAQVDALSDWQLHLDADEVLDDVAVREINVLLNSIPDYSAYMLRRRDYFMGKMLRFSGVNPWHLRLFRSGLVRCESRLYDQHFVTDRPAGRLRGLMHDKNMLSLADWISRHNRWSDLEAVESTNEGSTSADVLQGEMLGDVRERTRFLKGVYYRFPRGVRVLAYFFYRYVLRMGLLDGVHGFYFAFFQALWFRMLVDAKVYESRQSRPEL